MIIGGSDGKTIVCQQVSVKHMKLKNVSCSKAIDDGCRCQHIYGMARTSCKSLGLADVSCKLALIGLNQ